MSLYLDNCILAGPCEFRQLQKHLLADQCKTIIFLSHKNRRVCDKRTSEAFAYNLHCLSKSNAVSKQQ